MNRREAITGTLAAAVSLPLAAQNHPQVEVQNELLRSLWTQDRYAGQKSLTITELVHDDPDVQEISISVLLKKGKQMKGLDSYVLERVLLKHIGTSMISWFQHCRDNGMKTL